MYQDHLLFSKQEKIKEFQNQGWWKMQSTDYQIKGHG